MKENSKKIIISGGIVLTIILIVSIGTYALLTWTSSNISITGTADCFNINYVKGEDIGSEDNPANFILASDYTEGLSSSLNVSVSDECNITNGNGTLYLNTDTSATSEVLLNNDILKYQVLNGTTEVANGSVTTGTNGKLAIYSNIPITTETKTLTVYLWIDENNVTSTNSSAVLSSNYKGNISLEVESGDK